MILLTDEGRAALELAAAQPDPTSLAAATALRREFSPELAGAALQQEALRRKAVVKLGEAARGMLFTPDGLEQATRRPVAEWRARRLVAAGVREVVDLGCGIAADAMVMAEHGLRVTGVELDPDTAALAAHNLSLVQASGAEAAEASVRVGDAVALAPELLSRPDVAAFVDPARRTSRGRSWRVEDLSPSWGFVLALVTDGPPAVVKLGPGVDRAELPAVFTSHVSHRGDAVETTLWSGLELGDGAGPGIGEAVLVSDEVRTLNGPPETLPVGPLGRFVHEPDPAVSRAELVWRLAPDLVQLDQHAGYASSDQPLPAPFATSFEVLEQLDPRPKQLARWVKDHNIGTLEIKKRGRGGALDLDPAVLRKQLAPRGSQSAILMFCRIGVAVTALHVQRVNHSS